MQASKLQLPMCHSCAALHQTIAGSSYVHELHPYAVCLQW
jgi:hypothetical protein